MDDVSVSLAGDEEDGDEPPPPLTASSSTSRLLSTSTSSRRFTETCQIHVQHVRSFYLKGFSYSRMFFFNALPDALVPTPAGELPIVVEALVPTPRSLGDC